MKETYKTVVQAGKRVAIHKAVYAILKLRQGEMVKVTVEKL